MNEHIKNAILNGKLVILLGAGASKGSINNLGQDIPLGEELSKILVAGMSEEYNGENLSDAYAAAVHKLGNQQVEDIFEKHFKHCKPSNEYNQLARYPFFRIYTFNIDDAFEKAAHTNCNRKFNIYQRKDKIKEVDQLHTTLDYIKLNGDIARSSEGFVFSSQEYASGSADAPLWYEELGRDYFKYTFIFIGTKIDEPLFRHQIERHRMKTGSRDLKSYVLTPRLTKIENMSLITSNIHHLKGKLKDFTDWLKVEFETIPTFKEILANTRPEFDLNLANNSKFLNVILVNRANFPASNTGIEDDKIYDFYKGFKPSWNDIVNEIPASLKRTENFYNDYLSDNKAKPLDIYLILGAAGSGKSTALKQLALKLSDLSDKSVYFVGEEIDISALIRELDAKNQKAYYLFFESIGIRMVAKQISEIIQNAKSRKVIFVASENLRIWNTRAKEHLEENVSAKMDLSEIMSNDADEILNKIQRFGNWTRLEKMSVKNRKIALNKRSKRQLLMGLLEVMSGKGYEEIIRRDYESITNAEQRTLLILSGIAATNNSSASETTLVRALQFLGLSSDVFYIASQMKGIVAFHHGKVATRHRIYAETLFQNYIPIDEIFSVVVAYIKSFSVYKQPISKSVSKNEFSIYKKLVNFKALKKLLKNRKDLILDIYKKFEKTFENDSFLLLQYGLALRSFGLDQEAYEKLKIAHDAYPESSHIEHALSQQQLILAENSSDEVISMTYFQEAEETLQRMIQSRDKIYDRYPIVTLSIKHVAILDKFSHKKEAQEKAKEYYRIMRKDSGINKYPKTQETMGCLLRYCTNGTLPSNQDY